MANPQPTPAPIHLLQFGGGNFLRAFLGEMIQTYNEATGADLGIAVVVRKDSELYAQWREQAGHYHVVTRGFRKGQVVSEKKPIGCVRKILPLDAQWEAFLATAELPDLRFIVSNSTEAGIRFSEADQFTDAPPQSFPAKLTRWLYHRYQHVQGALDRGCILLPTELIQGNGQALLACLKQYAHHWELEAGFHHWLEAANTFCDTLVDRIVTGFSPEALPAAWATWGIRDGLMTQGEAYHFWALQAPAMVRQALPLHEVGLNVIFTDNLEPYRKRKVRVLNGLHTAMVPVGYLAGWRLVREAVEDPLVGEYLTRLLEQEILPVLQLPEAESQRFARDVWDRFRNPFIDHHLLDISLNSFSKVKSRLLPTLWDHQQQGLPPPPALSLALVCLIRFYRGTWQGQPIPLRDEPMILKKMANLWQMYGDDLAGLVDELLAWEAWWGSDLRTYPGLRGLLTEQLISLEQKGLKATLSTLISPS
ncbi:MAG: tagaturonate reductase [Bacteroidota bacterium]